MSAEDVKVPKILICILTTYERSGWPHPDLLDFVYSLRFNFSYATALVKAHNFIPAAGARNFFCRNMRDTDADWLLMIDNDMSPGANLLDTIKHAPEDAMVVVPRFHLWDHDAGTTKLCWGLERDPMVLPGGAGAKGHKIESGFHELTKCGTGAIFIRPALFSKIPAPWFWYTINDDQSMVATEDINFCTKVREHGYKIYGNANVEVGHHHTVNLLRLNEVLYGDGEVRPQAKEASARPRVEEEERPSESLVAVASPAD